MLLNLLSGIAAKLGAAGIAAKAGVGLTVAAASMGGAAAVGVLPEVPPAPTREPVEEVVTTDASQRAGLEDTGGETEEPAAHGNFGASVSADASDPESPGVDGAAVSEAARQLGQQHRPADPGSQGLARAGETPAAEHRPESIPAGPSTADQYRPDRPVAAPPAGVPAGSPEEGEAPEETPAAPEETPAGPPESVPAAPSGGIGGGSR